jgi:putative transposase
LRRIEVEFSEGSLEAIEELLKKEKNVRIFRRAQAIKEVIQGKTMAAVSRSFHFTYSALCKWIHRFIAFGIDGLKDLPRVGRPKKVTPEVEDTILRLILEDPLQHGSIYSQWTCSELLKVVVQRTGVYICAETLRNILKKNGFSYYRPTIELGADQQELARARTEIDELKTRAKRGEIILLFEDETIVWRFALPRAGWWYKDKRYRINDLKDNRKNIKQQECEKRQQWKEHRSWSHITCGVLLCVIGTIQYLTSRALFKIVPHFDAKEFKQFLYQVMNYYAKENKMVIMIADRNWIHKAKLLRSFLALYLGKFDFYFLPPHSGHHLNVIEGFWHPLKDAIGAARSYDHIHTLYQRTRTVFSKHQKQPIYHFSWN